MTAPRGHTGRNKPFGLIERRIATRYLGAKKTQGGVGLIAGISFICIMLAIAAMIIIMSIMNGFRSEVIRLTIGSQGHMYVQVADTAISPEKINQIEQRLQSIEGVEEAFEFTQDFTGVQANGTFALGQVIGIRPDELRAFELISDNITQGSLDNFGTGFGSDHQIAVGQFLATGLGLSVGNRITIYSPRTRATAFSHPQPIRKTYTIGAVFQTHLVETDQTLSIWLWMNPPYCLKVGNCRGKYSSGWTRRIMLSALTLPCETQFKAPLLYRIGDPEMRVWRWLCAMSRLSCG